jgi:hypothetical protein
VTVAGSRLSIEANAAAGPLFVTVIV